MIDGGHVSSLAPAASRYALAGLLVTLACGVGDRGALTDPEVKGTLSP